MFFVMFFLFHYEYHFGISGFPFFAFTSGKTSLFWFKTPSQIFSLFIFGALLKRQKICWGGSPFLAAFYFAL